MARSILAWYVPVSIVNVFSPDSYLKCEMLDKIQVGMIGTHFEDNHVATGFGNHLARPILRAEWREDLSFEEAVKLLEKCLLVLLYRDRSAINKFQV